MLGPYTALKNGKISYKGNEVFEPIMELNLESVPLREFKERVEEFDSSNMWAHIARINHQINISVNDYFNKMNALFTPLPLTTRMISSPGAVYGKKAIDYTTDTYPISLKWFDLPQRIFLSESSQIYLELALAQKNVEGVYSIYNSFRKERTDATHLSEFHHVEFEGKVNQEENEKIALGLIKKMISDLLNKNKEDMLYFLSAKKIEELEEFTENIFDIPKITFKDALDLLYEETKDEKYKEFSLKNFGQWEEIKITEILGGMVLIREFPLLEVPFYHSESKNKKLKVANNADIIWGGYREILGSGARVESKEELEKKARIFNLPKEDYKPYMQTRRLKNYKKTSGFGLGWERFLQGLLEMPFIWSAVHFPRTDRGLVP